MLDQTDKLDGVTSVKWPVRCTSDYDVMCVDDRHIDKVW